VAVYLRWRQGVYDSPDQPGAGGAGQYGIRGHAGQTDTPGMDEQSRFRGCLLAGAVGDALGAAVEFMSLSRICANFGVSGIRDFAEYSGRKGAITDDTQMVLFTAEGLIRGLVQERHQASGDYSVTTANAYQRWLLTQGECNQNGLDPLDPEPGWLYGVKELHARRAPGQTCRAALREATELGQPAVNDSKGCGGIVRVAPAGLFATSIEESFDLGCRLAALTHGHTTGWLAGGALAAMISALQRGDSLPEAINIALQCLAQRPAHAEVTAALEQALDLVRDDSDQDLAIAQLGKGWFAEEALAIATYCALVAPDIREGLIMAVNHDGDSDSTGAIAGNLLGVMWGEQGIPAPWLKRLELRKVITEVADDLLACRQWSIGPDAEENFDRQVWQKYPGY
jgi:ADP-ribosylglycohydrolase